MATIADDEFLRRFEGANEDVCLLEYEKDGASFGDITSKFRYHGIYFYLITYHRDHVDAILYSDERFQDGLKLYPALKTLGVFDLDFSGGLDMETFWRLIDDHCHALQSLFSTDGRERVEKVRKEAAERQVREMKRVSEAARKRLDFEHD